jgi:hypothetical protein
LSSSLLKSEAMTNSSRCEGDFEGDFPLPAQQVSRREWVYIPCRDQNLDTVNKTRVEAVFYIRTVMSKMLSVNHILAWKQDKKV